MTTNGPEHGALKYKEMKAVSAEAVSCCVCDKPKINYAALAWQLSMHVRLLGQFSCSNLLLLKSSMARDM